MKKRHRRTKAEMAAFRASQIEKKANKYLERIERKMEQKNVSSDMRPVTNLEIPDDGKLYDLDSVYGTEAEMNEFYRKNKQNCVAVPFLHAGEIWKVNFWKEITEEQYKNRYSNLTIAKTDKNC